MATSMEFSTRVVEIGRKKKVITYSKSQRKRDAEGNCKPVDDMTQRPQLRMGINDQDLCSHRNMKPESLPASLARKTTSLTNQALRAIKPVDMIHAYKSGKQDDQAATGYSKGIAKSRQKTANAYSSAPIEMMRPENIMSTSRPRNLPVEERPLRAAKSRAVFDACVSDEEGNHRDIPPPKCNRKTQQKPTQAQSPAPVEKAKRNHLQSKPHQILVHPDTTQTLKMAATTGAFYMPISDSEESQSEARPINYMGNAQSKMKSEADSKMLRRSQVRSDARRSTKSMLNSSAFASVETKKQATLPEQRGESSQRTLTDSNNKVPAMELAVGKHVSEGSVNIAASNPQTSMSPVRERNKCTKVVDLISSPKQTACCKVPKGQQTPSKATAKMTRSPRVALYPLNDMSIVRSTSSVSQHLSPRAQRIWGGLLGGVDSERPIIEEQVAKSRSPTPVVARALCQPSGISKYPQKAQPTHRRRLVDALIQGSHQIKAEEGSPSPDGADASAMMDGIIMEMEPVHMSREQTFALETQESFGLKAASQISQNGYIKRTYEKQRSWLPEQDLLESLALGLPSQSDQSSIALQSLSSFREDDHDTGRDHAILSVHELRQAGANSRFHDEVSDILDRVGSASGSSPSMKRSALLDLAEQMKDKEFARQFRAGGFEQKLFMNLGSEKDVVSCYLMVSLLIDVLHEASMPHMVGHLRRHGISRLLLRLLAIKTSIVALAGERKSNMSKSARSLLSEHHDHMLQIPVWESLRPTIVSPRTLTLKCLEMMVRQTSGTGDVQEIMSQELIAILLDILNIATTGDVGSFFSGRAAVDLYLAISVLESHFVVTRSVEDEAIWISEYLPIIARTLQLSLEVPAEQHGQIQILLMRLTLNLTNNNVKASDVFAQHALMATMGQTTIQGFARISQLTDEEQFSKALDLLVLVLGVMINFAESSLDARVKMQSLEGKSNDPLDDMVQVLLNNQERASEAASFEDSQRNIPYGYLSVLLGYLSLEPSIAERIRWQQPGKTLEPVRLFIEDFIMFHKAVDAQIMEADGSNAHGILTKRLEGLVDQLKAI